MRKNYNYLEFEDEEAEHFDEENEYPSHSGDNEIIYMEGGIDNYTQILPLNVDEEEDPIPPPLVNENEENNDIIFMEGGIENYTQIVKSNIMDSREAISLNLKNHLISNNLNF